MTRSRAHEPRCKALTLGLRPCKRRAQWEGLCFQHWRERELHNRAAAKRASIHP